MNGKGKLCLNDTELLYEQSKNWEKEYDTLRGVKVGDSVIDIADSYGKPDSITVDNANAEWSDITYAYLNYSIVFVVSDDKIIDIRMYDLK